MPAGSRGKCMCELQAEQVAGIVPTVAWHGLNWVSGEGGLLKQDTGVAIRLDRGRPTVCHLTKHDFKSQSPKPLAQYQ